MGRRILTGSLNARRVGIGQGGVPPNATANEAIEGRDDFLGRLLKYIPAEIIGLYLSARGFVPQDSSDSAKLVALIAILAWMLVPVYFWVATTRNQQKPLLIQILLGTIAFPVWVFAIGGLPVSEIGWYQHHPSISSIVLIFVTFIFGLISPPPGA